MRLVHPFELLEALFFWKPITNPFTKTALQVLEKWDIQEGYHCPFSHPEGGCSIWSCCITLFVKAFFLAVPLQGPWSYLQWLRRAWLLADSLQTGGSCVPPAGMHCPMEVALTWEFGLCPGMSYIVCEPFALLLEWVEGRSSPQWWWFFLVLGENVSQRGNWDSNIHLHLSQLLASAVRCDCEDVLVAELRRCKTSLLKLTQEADT